MIHDSQEFNNARIMVLGVADDSPSHSAGIEIGDIITGTYVVGDKENTLIENLDRTSVFLNFLELQAKGKDIALMFERGDETLDTTLTVRGEYKENEGMIGVVITRVADIKTVWYKAPFEALRIVGVQTIEMPRMTASVIARLIKGEEVIGFKVAGIVGIGKMMGRSLGQGTGNFFNFVAMISIWLAIFNLLPIPALDGGRLLFLAIEGIRGRPVSEKIENKITMAFFILLIGLMILITIKDIIGLF